jgi:co-chaperonin GroES (HSP10)
MPINSAYVLLSLGLLLHRAQCGRYAGDGKFSCNLTQVAYLDVAMGFYCNQVPGCFQWPDTRCPSKGYGQIVLLLSGSRILKWHLRSSGMLRGIEWWFWTKVSGLTVPSLKGKKSKRGSVTKICKKKKKVVQTGVSNNQQVWFSQWSDWLYSPENGDSISYGDKHVSLLPCP